MSLDKNRKIHIVDTTLRDGSHAVSHSYTVEQVTAIASGLDKVGVDIIELSHGAGLAGSSINYGFSATPEMELIRAASQVVRRARLGVLLLPGVGTIEDLKEARANGAQVVRVATHVTEADIAIQHLKAARELGMMPVGFLMMAHMAPPEKILEQAQIFVDAGAEYVNIADSAGYMTPDDVRARISLLVEKLPIPVGFHAHNNLGLAVANALTAAECGADYIDVTCRGLGAGAGNAQAEVVAGVFQRLGYSTGLDFYSYMDLAAPPPAPHPGPGRSRRRAPPRWCPAAGRSHSTGGAPIPPGPGPGPECSSGCPGGGPAPFPLYPQSSPPVWKTRASPARRRSPRRG